MYCPNCGSQNPDGAGFCSNCGHGFTAQTVPVQTPAAPINLETESMRKKATTSMVLGIIACVVAWYPITSIVSIVLGAIAISMAKKVAVYFATIALPTPGMATAGKVTGIIGLIFGILMTLFYLVVIVLGIVAGIYATQYALDFDMSSFPFDMNSYSFDVPASF